MICPHYLPVVPHLFCNLDLGCLSQSASLSSSMSPLQKLRADNIKRQERNVEVK